MSDAESCRNFRLFRAFAARAIATIAHKPGCGMDTVHGELSVLHPQQTQVLLDVMCAYGWVVREAPPQWTTGVHIALAGSDSGSGSKRSRKMTPAELLGLSSQPKGQGQGRGQGYCYFALGWGYMYEGQEMQTAPGSNATAAAMV